jgi:SNF2 family DNA or RNA helicase
MNFLDPKEFGDLDGMEKRYSVPDEELYKELRAKIAPFMLRRSKEEVLDLPPKVRTASAACIVRLSLFSENIRTRLLSR